MDSKISPSGKIDVLGCEYTVEERQFEDETNGLCVADSCKIILKTSLCPDKKKQTFIHELLHAIENSNNAMDDLSEIQIEQLATGLYAFIKDNPEVIKWLKGTGAKR